MPKLEKLDNNGKPTGEFVVRKDSVAKKLLRFKNSKFRLVEKEKPKHSRENPVTMDELIPDLPKSPIDQLEWIKNQKDTEKLTTLVKMSERKTIKAAAQTRLKELQSKK